MKKILVLFVVLLSGCAVVPYPGHYGYYNYAYGYYSNIDVPAYVVQPVVSIVPAPVVFPRYGCCFY